MADNCLKRDANSGKRVPKGRDLAIQPAKKYSVFGTKELTLEVVADSPQVAAAMMRDKGFTPVSVEELESEGPYIVNFDCIGKCEACGKELLEGDKYVSFLDGPMICAEHE